jgi:hypothetical protein
VCLHLGESDREFHYVSTEALDELTRRFRILGVEDMASSKGRMRRGKMVSQSMSSCYPHLSLHYFHVRIRGMSMKTGEEPRPHDIVAVRSLTKSHSPLTDSQSRMQVERPIRGQEQRQALVE